MGGMMINKDKRFNRLAKDIGIMKLADDP